MTDESVRRRAPGMTADERRSAIVRAALPLIAEFGAAVTTARIARAAGIGEATVFRVFADKEALLKACIAEALDPENLLSQLRSIPLEGPLEDRLIEAAEALDAHLGRMGDVMRAMHASGLPNRRPSPDVDAEPTKRLIAGREASQAATKLAIVELFEPDRDQLRVSAEAAADVFLRLHAGRPMIGEPADRRAQIDVLLHGALKTA